MQDARRSSNRKRLHGKVGMSSISVFLLLLLPVPFLPSLPAIHGNEIKKSYSASPPFFSHTGYAPSAGRRRRRRRATRGGTYCRGRSNWLPPLVTHTHTRGGISVDIERRGGEASIGFQAVGGKEGGEGTIGGGWRTREAEGGTLSSLVDDADRRGKFFKPSFFFSTGSRGTFVFVSSARKNQVSERFFSLPSSSPHRGIYLSSAVYRH